MIDYVTLENGIAHFLTQLDGCDEEQHEGYILLNNPISAVSFPQHDWVIGLHRGAISPAATIDKYAFKSFSSRVD